MTELAERFQQRRHECAEILEKLLAAPAFGFDQSLRSRLPVKHGLYTIAENNSSGMRILHAGRTSTAKEGLRSRVWDQHVNQGGKDARSDLIQKVMDRQRITRESAKAWIRSNCVAQWLVLEDDDLRCWAEHYILSILRPIWGR